MNDTPQPADDDGGVPVGDIRFYQAIIPPLEDGNYTLRARQTLADLPGAEPSPSIPTVTLQFAVRGPRFTLNPADISSYFPPPSPPTPFEGQLPHVVVARKTLPWERLLGPGPDYQGVPWLGLLVVDEDDHDGIPKVQSGTVADLLSDGGKLPEGTIGPALSTDNLDDGESADDPCNYIELPADLFASIAPRLADLPFLAHARGVDTGNKPIEGILADGIYSVLVGNRVPHESAVNAALLVSLEGFGELLTGEADGEAARKAAGGATTIRLAVLHSWNFEMGGEDPFDFLMSADRSGLLAIEPPAVTVPKTGANCTPQAITVPAPDPASPAFVEETVRYARQSGYAALTHDFRDGGQTFSWYRGPLIPYLLGLVVNEDQSNPVFRTADSLLRYDPASGLFDTSYAAAFELGWLLALQSEGFVVSLRTYLHQVKAKGLRLVSRQQLTAGPFPLDLPADRAASIRNGVVLDAVVRWLATQGAEALQAALGSTAPDGEVTS
jgi:hypothetical protein